MSYKKQEAADSGCNVFQVWTLLIEMDADG